MKIRFTNSKICHFDKCIVMEPPIKEIYTTFPSLQNIPSFLFTVSIFSVLPVPWQHLSDVWPYFCCFQNIIRNWIIQYAGFVSGFLHLAWILWYLTLLLHVSVVHSNCTDIPQLVFLSIHQLMSILIASRFSWLWNKTAINIHMYLFKYIFSFYWENN